MGGCLVKVSKVVSGLIIIFLGRQQQQKVNENCQTQSSAQVEPLDARYKRLDKHLHLRRQGGDQLFGAKCAKE